MDEELDRRLGAVMFTDMVGYTALFQADERVALDKRNRSIRGVAAALGVAITSPTWMPITPTAARTGVLLDLDLTFREGMSEVVPDAGRPGEYLGSGEGSAVGPDLTGSVRWDLSEHSGETACEMFFSGVIDTEDGASIRFDTSGYGTVPDPKGAPGLWEATAAVRFRTDDPRYAWLTGRPATWEGQLDTNTYRHRYRISRGA